MYINKQFDFSIPLTAPRYQLLYAIIHRLDSISVSTKLIPSLLETIIILLAKANFKDTNSLLDSIEKDVDFYLNKSNPRIFKLEDIKSNSDDFYQQYLELMKSRKAKKEETKTN